MSTPYLFYDELVASANEGGYSQTPNLSQQSAVFLLSLCLVSRMRWLWQNPIDPITDLQWQNIEDLITQAENELLLSRQIGTIIPSIANLDSDTSLLRMNGQTVAQVDYPTLSDLVPLSWISGLNIILPDMNNQSLHGNYSNVGAIVGANSITLTTSQIPSHSHTQLPHSHTDTTALSVPALGGAVPATASIVTITPSITGVSTAVNQPTGGDGSHDNIPESMAVIYYLVAL